MTRWMEHEMLSDDAFGLPRQIRSLSLIEVTQFDSKPLVSMVVTTEASSCTCSCMPDSEEEGPALVPVLKDSSSSQVMRFSIRLFNRTESLIISSVVMIAGDSILQMRNENNSLNLAEACLKMKTNDSSKSKES